MEERGIVKYGMEGKEAMYIEEAWKEGVWCCGGRNEIREKIEGGFGAHEMFERMKVFFFFWAKKQLKKSKEKKIEEDEINNLRESLRPLFRGEAILSVEASAGSSRNDSAGGLVVSGFCEFCWIVPYCARIAGDGYDVFGCPE